MTTTTMPIPIPSAPVAVAAAPPFLAPLPSPASLEFEKTAEAMSEMTDAWDAASFDTEIYDSSHSRSTTPDDATTTTSLTEANYELGLALGLNRNFAHITFISPDDRARVVASQYPSAPSASRVRGRPRGPGYGQRSHKKR